jgi:hypothetical protein
MLKRYLCFLFLLFTVPVFGQLSFQFIPEVYGRNIDGLFSCRIFDPGQKITAFLNITVTERKGGIVCIIKTPEFTIFPGMNSLPLSVARGSAIQFSSNKIGHITGLSRLFPEGDYDYCFEVNFVHSDNPPSEQCFPYTLAPFSVMNLIDPYNLDKVCNKRPLFTWEPLLPGIAGSYYQLVLTEIKQGQTATEALNYNLPIINQSNIISPILPYPSIAADLVPKIKYAWQVTAYKDQTVLNRTEIWQFTVDCQDSVKKIPDDGYRDIEDLLKGDFYIATGYIKFALVNPYQAQNLKYEILPISDIKKKVKQLPKIKLKNGANEIIIDLSRNATFVNGNYYIMNVWLPNGTQHSLRFLYEEDK